jgi:hypothetical protein
MPIQEYKRAYIWQLPVRIFHWANALSITLLIITGVFSGCSNNSEENESGIQIRIHNASPYYFENVIVNSGYTAKDIHYENLISNKKSNYKTFDLAYRYAFVELQIEGKTYTIQPIDYVGETELVNGIYTYKITANSSLNQYQKLDLEFIRD